jgi:two-component system cell cycle sensor histidine kinase/response regulator CckA
VKRLPFKVFADSSPDWELWIAPGGEILYCTPNCKRITGYTRREIIADPDLLPAIVHEDDRELWRRHAGEEKTSPGPLELVFRIRTRSGEYRRLHHYCRPILDEKGAFMGRHVCHHRVTDPGAAPAGGITPARAQDALRALSTRYWAILSAVPDIIMEVNKDKIYTWANHAGLDFFGPDVIGHEAVFYFEGDQATYETVQPLFNGNEDVIYLESWQRRHDGEKRLLAWWCRVLKDTEGNSVGALSSARDITEQSRAKDELRESESRYRRLLHSVTGYAYSVSVENGRAVSTVHGQGCAAVTGYSPQDYAADGFLWYRMIHEQDRRGVEEAVASLLDGGKPPPFEHRIRHRDGSLRWIRHALVTREGASGELLGYDGLIEDITDRKRVEEELQALTARIEALIRVSPLAIMLVDADDNVRMWNPSAQGMFGWTAEEVLGRPNPIVPEEMRVEYAAWRREILGGNIIVNRETVRRNRDGAILHVSISTAPVHDPSGNLVGRMAIIMDVTDRKRAEEERRRLEARLQQSQRLEAVGMLAGGIAHDFNNMLAVILGYAETLQDEIPGDSGAQAELGEIVRAATRSSALTRQLLAFARRQTLEMKTEDLNRIILDIQSMLRRSLRENISIDLRLSPSACTITADQGQIGQVILNLALNAQYAMPEGGRLSIETSEVFLDDAYSGTHADASRGLHVLLTVADTGKGMDGATMERIFEPFFTTKPFGEGTGLGLPTVYGIVKQHEGNIEVQSEPGKGSTFRIYFPKSRSPETGADPSPPQRDLHGSETVLVAEDQNELRRLVCRSLSSQGYDVLDASDGLSALRLSESHEGPIHLIVTDVIMEGMNGRELYERISEKRRGIRVVFMSGYAGNVITQYGLPEHDMDLLQKPFSSQTLVSKVREVLDRK